MKKRLLIFIIIAITVCVAIVYHDNFQFEMDEGNNIILPLGEYKMKALIMLLSPEIVLSEDNQFGFTYDYTSSHFHHGKYYVDDDRLVLACGLEAYEDEIYVFQIERDGLYFDADNLAELVKRESLFEPMSTG